MRPSEKVAFVFSAVKMGPCPTGDPSAVPQRCDGVAGGPEPRAAWNQDPAQQSNQTPEREKHYSRYGAWTPAHMHDTEYITEHFVRLCALSLRIFFFLCFGVIC